LSGIAASCPQDSTAKRSAKAIETDRFIGKFDLQNAVIWFWNPAEPVVARMQAFHQKLYDEQARSAIRGYRPFT
jgi:hypothetical protein